ncbi:MAG: hypothetical protein ACR2OH_13135 [Microthrixaceae bacterium]
MGARFDWIVVGVLPALGGLVVLWLTYTFGSEGGTEAVEAQPATTNTVPAAPSTTTTTTTIALPATGTVCFGWDLGLRRVSPWNLLWF